MDKYSRTQWFRDARFGLFLHWGVYAVPARGEWLRNAERMSIEDYQTYVDSFDPIDFDPRQWAREAKAAGMQYAVLTAKHHDGFCMYDSKYTDYKVTNTACGRDVVREFLEAFRAEGLRTGLYYSLIDWHHPDYPKYADTHHPMRGNPAYKEETIDFDRYLDYLHAQVEELVSAYGKLDILWFDFSYDELSGEAWRATELVRMVRRHQPGILLDNRLEASGAGFGSLVTAQPKEYSGDFVSPEQIIPSAGIRDEEGRPVPWELCMTMNNNWGYCATDRDYKPASLIIRKLISCVSKSGNMLLNIGPTARGAFPPESSAVLAEIGEWMHANSASIYGAAYAGLPKPEWGYYTRKGRTLYAHILDAPIGPLELTGLRAEQVRSVRRLADGSEVLGGKGWATSAYPDACFVSLGPVAHFTYPLPDPTATVLEISLNDEA